MNNNQPKKEKILMAVNALRGHAAPIMALAAELVRRGHDVTLSTGKQESVFGRSSSLWEEDAHPRMRFVFDGWDQHELVQKFAASLRIPKKCENNSAEVDIFTSWSELNDMKVCQQTVSLLAMNYRLHFPVLDALLREGGYDLVIADYLCAEALDAARLHEVPCVVNCPGLRVPSNCKTSATFPVLGLPLPLIRPLHRFVNHLLLTMNTTDLLLRGLRAVRKQLLPKRVYQQSVPPAHVEVPVLFNTVIGVSEVAQCEPPLSHHVGALLPKVQREELLAMDKPQSYQQLSGDLRHWFDEVVPKTSDVVFINFGTTGAFQRWKWEVFLEAITSLANNPERSPPYFLWRMSKPQQDLLRIRPGSLPKHIRFSTWIEPHQQAVLCHPKVALFVTHAGINSPQEGIACGVPLLMVPTFADQVGHATRLASHGLGRTAGKGRFSANELRRSLEDLLWDRRDCYRENVRRARSLCKNAGGTDAAADAVEEVLEVGYAHLVPCEKRLPRWQGQWNLDIAIGYGLLAGGLGLAASAAVQTLQRSIEVWRTSFPL